VFYHGVFFEEWLLMAASSPSISLIFGCLNDRYRLNPQMKSDIQPGASEIGLPNDRFACWPTFFDLVTFRTMTDTGLSVN